MWFEIVRGSYHCTKAHPLIDIHHNVHKSRGDLVFKWYSIWRDFPRRSSLLGMEMDVKVMAHADNKPVFWILIIADVKENKMP